MGLAVSLSRTLYPPFPRSLSPPPFNISLTISANLCERATTAQVFSAILLFFSLGPTPFPV